MYRRQNYSNTHIEAISARDRTTKLNPKKFQIYDQNNPANPPSTKPCVFALERKYLPKDQGGTRIYISRYSHTAVKTVAKLSAERGR